MGSGVIPAPQSNTMPVRIWKQPLIHRSVWWQLADPRIGWTLCGIRFAWGQIPKGDIPKQGRCEHCFSEIGEAIRADWEE